MFNPEMLAAAQKMMANMSPEQMSQIAGMASKMDPNILKNMGGGNAGLPMPTPAQLEEAKEKMKNMSADDMKNMMADANSKMSGQNAYMVNGATVIKNEGNDKVRRGDYSGAIESFQSALTNLVACPTPDQAVITLIQSVRLNLALCYLKLAQFEEVVSTCTEILTQDPKNVKALYRRGIAHRELGSNLQSVLDLKLSHLLSPTDEIVKTEFEKTFVLITDPAEVISVDQLCIPLSHIEKAKSVIESNPAVPLSHIEQAKSVIESNPAVIEQMGSVFAEMDDTQIDGLLQMSGAGTELGDMKKILKDKDFMKTMTEMMKGMDSSGDMSKMLASGDMSKMLSSESMEKVVESMPPSMFDDMLTSQLGDSKPSFVTGARMKWVAKQLMRLIRIWIAIKNFFALLWSRKMAISICVLAIGMYYQYSRVKDEKDEMK